MSFFDDVTHAIGSVFQSVGNVIASPVTAIQKITQGQNIGEALKDIITSDFGNAENILTVGGQNLLASSDVQSVLRSNILNKLTLNIPANFAGFVQTSNDLAAGTKINNLTSQERDEWIRTVLTTGAVVGAAVLAPALVPTTVGGAAETLGTASTVQAGLNKGGIGGILDASSGLAGEGDLGDALDTANDIYSITNPGPQKNPQKSAPPKQAPPKPGLSTGPATQAPAPTAQASPSSSGGLALAGLTFAVLKRVI